MKSGKEDKQVNRNTETRRKGMALTLINRSAVLALTSVALATTLVNSVGADSLGCSIVDQCGPIGYPWAHWSCFETNPKCFTVERQLCAIDPEGNGNWYRYRDVDSLTNYPCAALPCGPGSRCTPPAPPGGGG
jgi:hypothetical protein